ncbi:MAG: malate dehydrogenase [Planctomycetota bacterium]|jgi:malate dehydrogenase
MHKVTVVGAGNVGATCAYQIADRNLADVVMIDILEGMPQGKALDMAQCGAIFDFDAKIEGANDIAACKGSDVCIVTSGVPRKPGMDRMDLLKINSGIIKEVSLGIKKHAPNSIIIMVANPLDVMSYVALKTSGFPGQKVFGMAGVLDAARFRRFLAWELGVSIRDVNAMVLGGHGDQMVPLARFSTFNGITVTELIKKDRLDAIIERTRKGGGEIVKLLKTGSAYYAPAGCAVLMTEAILRDTHHVLPCSAFLTGEYGHEGFHLGVPCEVGRNGIEKIIQLDLNEEEKAAVEVSVAAVKKGVADVEQFL